MFLLFLLCVISLADGARELITAGCLLESAVDAAQFILNLINRQTVHKTSDGLEISVASVGVLHVIDTVVFQIELDFRRACSDGSVCMRHNDSSFFSLFGYYVYY